MVERGAGSESQRSSTAHREGSGATWGTQWSGEEGGVQSSNMDDIEWTGGHGIQGRIIKLFQNHKTFHKLLDFLIW